MTPVPFEPDVFSYQHYLSTCVKQNGKPAGSLESLTAALEEMAARGIVPRSQTFTPFAWLAFHVNDWPMAKVRLLRWRGSQPGLTRARSGCTTSC